MDSLISYLLFFIAAFNPNPIPESAVDIASLPVPKIHTVTSDRFKETVCLCSCDQRMQYVGFFYIDVDGNPAMYLTTGPYDNPPVHDPAFQSLVIHELYHYVQSELLLDDGSFRNQSQFSEEELIALHEKLETEAYKMQNVFIQQYGMWPMPIKEVVAWSLEKSKGSKTCMNSEGIPGHPTNTMSGK